MLTCGHPLEPAAEGGGGLCDMGISVIEREAGCEWVSTQQRNTLFYHCTYIVSLDKAHSSTVPTNL